MLLRISLTKIKYLFIYLFIHDNIRNTLKCLCSKTSQISINNYGCLTKRLLQFTMRHSNETILRTMSFLICTMRDKCHKLYLHLFFCKPLGACDQHTLLNTWWASETGKFKNNYHKRLKKLFLCFTVENIE